VRERLVPLLGISRSLLGDDANKEDIVKAARKMKAKGYPVGDIAEITGLTAEEIEGL